MNETVEIAKDEKVDIKQYRLENFDSNNDGLPITVTPLEDKPNDANDVFSSPEMSEEEVVKKVLRQRIRQIIPVEARRAPKTVGPNAPCPCGAINSITGKVIKYKKCCWNKDF